MFASPDQVISHEQAKRLAAKYAGGATTPLAVLYWTGRALATSFESIRAEAATRTGEDPQGFQADMRALSDYFESRQVKRSGFFDGVWGPWIDARGWDQVKSFGDEADKVVPWSYGREPVAL